MSVPKSSRHCFKKHEAAGSKRSDVFKYRKKNHVGRIETVDEFFGSTKVQSQVFIPFQNKSPAIQEKCSIQQTNMAT